MQIAIQTIYSINYYYKSIPYLQQSKDETWEGKETISILMLCTWQF